MRINRGVAIAIYNLLSIPGPGGGTASACISGFVGHSNDATAAMHMARKMIEYSGFGEHREAQRVADRSAKWPARRKTENWDTAHAGTLPEENLE